MENRINKVKWKQTELEVVRWLDDYILKVHGVVPGKKKDGGLKQFFSNGGNYIQLNTRQSFRLWNAEPTDTRKITAMKRSKIKTY